MKKSLLKKFIGLFCLLAIFVVIGIASCSKDDDDDCQTCTNTDTDKSEVFCGADEIAAAKNLGLTCK